MVSAIDPTKPADGVGAAKSAQRANWLAARDEIEVLQVDVGTLQGRAINTGGSLTGGGNLAADRTLQLSGDAASPGPNAVYGTDGVGTKGWKADPVTGALAALDTVGTGQIDDASVTPPKLDRAYSESGHTHADASGTVAGFMAAADKSKLDGIEAGAAADQTGAEIKMLYEAEIDTNAFTDAAQGKLAGIEAGAQVNRALASQAEAEAGTDNIKGMTPLRTAQAVAALAGDFAGTVVSGNLAATGTATGLLAGADSGKVLRTAANVTIPQTPGFNITLIAGGAHTVTFGATVSPAMAAGDLMSIVVDDQSAIHAVRTPSADKVAFS